MTKWEAYLGIPFVPGGRDPGKGLDCWGLLAYVYDAEFAIQISPYAAPLGEVTRKEDAIHELDSGVWVPTDTPQDGDGVAMGRRCGFHHVGIYVDDQMPSILHSLRSASTIQSVRFLVTHGYPLLQFYRHVERPLH